MTYLLDTNHASRLLRPNDPMWERVNQAIAAGDLVCIPLAVVTELQFGVEATRDPQQRQRRIADLNNLLSLFPAPGLTFAAAQEAGRIRGRLRRRGHQLDVIDAHLVGMAIEGGDTIVTDDRDFGPLAAEVAIENWL